MRGWEGLYGRPRPVHRADNLEEHEHSPTPPATDHLALRLVSQLMLMPIG